MVKEKVEFDANKMGDIQKDVIHFERLIGDLIGILSKSISFCVHSGESVNELVNRLTRNCDGMNDKNGVDPQIIIQESSFLNENDTTMNNNDNGIDYIRFTSNGPVYSLPKRVTNSLVGTYLYEQCQDDQKTVDGEAYLDYPYDETVAPLLIDSLMNKKINIDKLKLGDQIDLLRMFEYCNLPIPEEFVKYPYRFRKNHVVKQYKEGDDVILYINDKKDDILRNYLKKNGLWNKIVNEYGYGYVDYDEKENFMFMKMNFEYINYINCFARNECLFIDDKNNEIINSELLENEMYSLFGDQGKNALKEDMNGKPIVFTDSKIINKKCYETPLVNWLGKEKKWKLLFRASEHDYKSSEFHKYCNNKGETVTLIKHIGQNNHINIFGGYTDQSWAGSCSWKPYSKEFLFTLSNEHGIPPTKYDYTQSDRRYGIYCDSSYGPTFGGGFDIYISNDCHSNTNSYCNACSYSEVNTPQKSSLFVNTNNANSTNKFTVEDYEVWGRA
ncbi:hypothetical protein WA158_007351 [Blastocystis sp. Blastoise]